MLKAGVAQVEITPPIHEELAGYPHYPRHNTGAHDPLYAACMYIGNEQNEIALVSLDLLFFSKKHVQEVRKRVEERCGMAGSHVMICCIHTHSGPWAAGRLDIESLEAGAQQPKAYVEGLIEKITNLVMQARSQSFPASFASGAALCGAESGIGGNRRIPGGPHDPMVSFLAVRDGDGVVRGIFANYALHPTFLHEWNTLCSADYVAYLRQELKEQEKDAVVGFFQGASGNQSSRYYRKGESFDEAERVGRTLGRAVYTALQEADWEQEPELAAASDSLDLELRNFGTEEELAEKVRICREQYEKLYAQYGTSQDRKEYYLWQNANLKLLGAEDQLGYVRMRNRGSKIELLEDEVPAEIQVFRIGNACVIGVPGEIFVEYALYVKAMAGFKTVMFNELANGCLPGYLYTPEALLEGGYETDTSMLAETFGRKLVDCVLDTVALVKQKKR